MPPLEHGELVGGVRRFRLTAQDGVSHFLPGRSTPTRGFNGPFLGPALRMRRGEQVAIEVRNRMAETTTVHWHGMRLPAEMDGGPHQPVEPGTTWTPTWPVDQPAATLWYHPHPHGATAAQLQQGLGGLILVEDPEVAENLPSTYGVDDVPVILQDRSFADGGAFDDATVPTFGLMGDTVLVNGVIAPTLSARTREVRLRILNASNARMYHLEWSDRRSFLVVGGDAGHLARPVETTRVSLSPAERAEIVVAFDPGEQVVLRSRSGGGDIDEGDFDLLRVRVARRVTGGNGPLRLAAAPEIEPPAGAVQRTFELNGHDAINGEPMSMSRIDTVVPAGTTEIWTVVNHVYAHNFHVHGAAFRILDTDGEPPATAMRGPKDTVFVPPRSQVRIAVELPTYEDPEHAYMYHCHLLRHEDSGMMGQYVAVAPGTEDSVARTPQLSRARRWPAVTALIARRASRAR